ncbi:MAG: glutamate synthase-related protein, partial [Armatimonadota bacterium]|nr:glutamate synthase-related protein [Armatimonadota bacterium]
STLAGYQGGQVFEVVGLDPQVVERYFPGTPAHLGGVSLDELAAQAAARHARAFAGDGELADPGLVRFRRDGEYHAFNPYVVKRLHQAAQSGSGQAYTAFADLVASRPPTALRDLLAFVRREPVPLEEVEPADAIVRRFVLSAMSHGALSREAHEALAIAANRLGARSNSGEGGEDPSRYLPRPDGTNANSRIKQVASARFGVTAAYLVSADELEIKMAQGSKPGEGGQLPGHKVSAEIAAIRRAQPGITLISPPPHHDIYSIEDLAQLIYDLKRVHPLARVAVKLVAEAGVGTIAAGVAKAFADTIQISGHDGGTGASPLESIKHVGLPWELGLAETQQVLVASGLRGRVRLRVDGGLKTGRDVVVAALLGADEFGFGTAALVALGCVMARACHLNTCPTGIATQREDLRGRFSGRPERVEAYLLAVAEEVRRHLAALGARTLEEVIGRSELLSPVDESVLGRRIGLSALLAGSAGVPEAARRCMQARNKRPEGPTLDDRVWMDAWPALERGIPVHLTYSISNMDRTVGGRLAGAIARRYGEGGLGEGRVVLRFTGSAGQSFGAFCVPGMVLELEGEVNDYAGKGMSGGTIAIRPPRGFTGASHENVIAGNTVLYGATGGRFFAAGRAGERFAVRNSGAVAVVEGVGDHGCEYMTGGVVVVLGRAGYNFGAGMTGGRAYVLDEDGLFAGRCNQETVSVVQVEAKDLHELRDLLAEHLAHTGSRRAAELLQAWPFSAGRLRKVLPRGLLGQDAAEAAGSPDSELSGFRA